MMYFLGEFVFLYPLAMSIVWMIGALCFFIRRELGKPEEAPVLEHYPFVTVIIPAHNEEATITSTVLAALASDYPAFEVIVVDDQSTDQTAAIVKELAWQHPALRLLSLETNMGKPTALRYGALAANGDILVTIDADAYIDPDAIRWMVAHFVTGPRVGAVTGNPRVRNRTSLLAKIQVGEYSAIIGMIKRTQRLIGKMLTVSGVIAAFNKRALYEVGFWDADMITDDINVTWKLEKKFWDIRYEPHALCWILCPETVRGLWKQRLRWAQGGVEVIRRHADIWTSWKQRRLWPVYIEYVVSVIWSYALVLLVLIWLVSWNYPLPVEGMSLLPRWHGAILFIFCIMQFMIAMVIDTRYEKNLLPYLFWVIWYPMVYWLLSALATVWATPKALLRRMGTPAIWTSPDRGLFDKL